MARMRLKEMTIPLKITFDGNEIRIEGNEEGFEVSYLTEGHRPIEWTADEKFRKFYKSKNLPRSGLLEQVVGGNH